MNEPVINTDKEIWRETEGEYYCPKIFVTEKGNIGIDVGGYVYVKTVEEWHRQSDRIAELEKDLALKTRDRDVFRDFTLAYEKRIDELEKVIQDGIKTFGEIQNQRLKDKFETPQTKPLSDEEIDKFIEYANMQGYGSSYCEGLSDGIEWALAKVRGEK